MIHPSPPQSIRTNPDKSFLLLLPFLTKFEFASLSVALNSFLAMLLPKTLLKCALGSKNVVTCHLVVIFFSCPALQFVPVGTD